MKPGFIAYLAAITLLVSLIAASAASPAIADSGVTRQIALAGTGSPLAGEFTPSGSATDLEFPAQEDEATPESFDGTIDRSLSRGSGSGLTTATAKKAKANPRVDASFEGLNFYQQRYSRGGNQFSVEPPDQGMCVGNGYIVEAVNDVFNVFNFAGASVLPDNTSTNIVAGHARNVNHAIDLNSFFQYPPAINRTTGVRGPNVTDPTCYYDAQTQRFYLVVLTYILGPHNSLVENHLDIAVSATSNPTGTWNIYKVDVTNDGTHTIADNACPCLGDYPHIGADANGFYVTTNAYPWNGDGFNGAQIYAFSKRQLASGAASVNATHLDTFASVNVMTGETPSIKQPGFTLWPAQSPGTTSYALDAGGTEYFLSSNAADEATHPVSGTGGNYISSQIVLWALTNTSSLDSTTPSISLTNTVLAVGQYALPPKADQPGSGSAPTTATPQGYCLNNETTVLFNGASGCWKLLVGAAVHAARGAEVVSRLDSNDTRMQQVMYANGKVWGALDTAVSFDANPAHNKAGVAWYIVKPDVSTGSVSGSVALTGTNGVEGKNVVYPAIGVTPSGRGVVAITLVGPNDFPSAAYAAMDAQAGMGDVQIVAAGAATDDGFTSYKQQLDRATPRTRWGDYGAAAVDGNSIWIASEYIAHACDYTTWGGPFFADGTGDNLLGTCSGSPDLPGTRAALGNWSTRISKLTP
ncbi:MAG TPA: hypothetical protein VK732_01450 [Verrucomicrobiae bacterium]|nr:hypothetical protein [Verrucomicrobiae bacterium]